MSVKAVDRSESQMEFLKNARDIEISFIKTMASRPKRYRFFYQKMIDIAIDSLNHLKKGNSIYVEVREDAIMRMQEFKMALADDQALISQMEIIYYLFKDEGMSMNQIKETTEMIDKEINLIRGLLKSDRTRYKSLLKENDE